jgi:hypothetical protein
MATDPKLTEAWHEIHAILKKHDLAGHVVLVSPTHAQFHFDLSPSWSALFVEEDKDGHDVLRFKALKAELGSKEAVRERVELTCHIVYQLRDLTGWAFMTSDGLIKEVEKHYGHEIEHESFAGFDPLKEN